MRPSSRGSLRIKHINTLLNTEPFLLDHVAESENCVALKKDEERDVKVCLALQLTELQTESPLLGKLVKGTQVYLLVVYGLDWILCVHPLEFSLPTVAQCSGC